MEASPEREPKVNKLFRLARKVEASDFYLHIGSPPLMRVGGVTRPTLLQPLAQEDLEHLLVPLLFPEQQRHLDQQKEVSFTYSCEEGSLYRVSVSNNSGQLRVAAHRVEG